MFVGCLFYSKSYTFPYIAYTAVSFHIELLSLQDDPSKILRTGEPTEAAIRVLVEKMGCPDESVNKR